MRRDDGAQKRTGRVSFSEMSDDLIILTAPLFDPANPATAWGSMSYKIGMLAQCPVRLLR